MAERVDVLRDGQAMQLDIPVDFVGQLVDENDSIRPVSLRQAFLISEIPDTSANANSGLLVHDIIVDVDNQGYRYYDQITAYLNAHKNDTMVATVLRDGNTQTLDILTSDEGKLGVIVTNASLKDLGKLGFYEHSIKTYTFGESFGAGSRRFIGEFKSFKKQLNKIANPNTGAYKGLGSFISIAKIFPTTWNWEVFWRITAFLSIMLGVLNLLPIPALDGGHAMFLIYEMVAGKKPGDKFMEYAQVVGFILLICLFVFAFGNDIYRHFIK